MRRGIDKGGIFACKNSRRIKFKSPSLCFLLNNNGMANNKFNHGEGTSKKIKVLGHLQDLVCFYGIALMGVAKL